MYSTVQSDSYFTTAFILCWGWCRHF